MGGGCSFLRAQALRTLGQMIRGHRDIQDEFVRSHTVIAMGGLCLCAHGVIGRTKSIFSNASVEGYV